MGRMNDHVFGSSRITRLSIGIVLLVVGITLLGGAITVAIGSISAFLALLALGIGGLMAYTAIRRNHILQKVPGKEAVHEHVPDHLLSDADEEQQS